ncbi:MAG: hypothetical protein ACR2L8_16950 [Solirubrobacteraceae bacterium]
MSAWQTLKRAMRRVPALAVIVAVALLAGCGEEETGDNAVEAQEQNTVELGGVRYRVILFRQLNVRGAPDDALWEGQPSESGKGLYVVLVRACAAAGEPARMSERIHLEDAFGQRFEPRPADTADKFEYSAVRLEPSECRPVPGSAADRTFDGVALVFDVPFESTAERPMILEIGDPTGSGAARIQLDL